MKLVIWPGTIDILADELKANEQERLNREQARVDFFANVSHELRTPITVIRAYAESLVDGVITDEDKILQYYQRIIVGMQGNGTFGRGPFNFVKNAESGFCN
jgi:signal transduction histidine kinase